MSLFEFMEKRDGLLADYVYYIDKAKEATRKYAMRNLLMGFYLWQMHHYRKKAARCCVKIEEIRNAYFKEHFNHIMGS